MRFEINGIMKIGVAFKLSKKRTRKPLVDVFPQYFFSEN